MLMQDCYNVYVLTCLPTTRQYFGITSQPPQKRMQQHRYNPCKAMLLDVHTYTPYDRHFTMEVLHCDCTHAAAVTLKKSYIAAARTAGQNPYNTCTGHPAHCRRFAYMKDKHIV
jgi:hypothetical protein